MMKKIKITIYIVAVLWLAAATQLAVNLLFVDDERIMDAFADTKSEIIRGQLDFTLDYGAKFLSESDKKNLIKYMADAIGLNNDYELTIKENENNSTIKAEKKAQYAATSIEMVSAREQDGDYVKTRQYLFVHLDLYEKMNSIFTYKEMLEKAAKDLRTGEYQTLITFTGERNGKLSEEEIRQEADALLSSLEARVVWENREEGLYTVYAYTGLVKEYLKVSGEAININMAVTYDEREDKTNFYLATPVLNIDF